MAKIERSIEIRAPVEKVFDFVADWRNKLRFFEGIYDWKPTTEKTRGDGARFVYKVKVLGREYETEDEVSDFVENRRWSCTSVRGVQSKHEWIFSRLDEKTIVIFLSEYKPPVPILGVVLDVLFFKWRWQRNVERSLQNLKKLLEEQTPG